MINNRLTELNLPPLMEKEKMLDILLREEYGYLLFIIFEIPP